MEIIATLFFAGLKVGAYFCFLLYFAPELPKRKIWRIAVIRLLFGLILGMSLYALFSEGRDIIPVYFSAILIGRFVLWFSLFKLFYPPMPNSEIFKLTIGGTIVSYIIDLPAMLGAISIIGGIC